MVARIIFILAWILMLISIGFYATMNKAEAVYSPLFGENAQPANVGRTYEPLQEVTTIPTSVTVVIKKAEPASTTVPEVDQKTGELMKLIQRLEELLALLKAQQGSWVN